MVQPSARYFGGSKVGYVSGIQTKDESSLDRGVKDLSARAHVLLLPVVAGELLAALVEQVSEAFRLKKKPVVPGE